MAIASLVLGILALVGLFFPIPGGSIVLAIIGIVLGVIAKKQLDEQRQPAGQAVAGIVMSIVALALSIVFTMICFVCACALNPFNWF
jgi:uncharacterized membrane protein